jgi:hypothetical protein
MPSPRRLRSRALAILALFAATNALPRPGLYAHHHAGGDHAHVHPWGEDAYGDDDDGDHDHDHAAADDRPGFEDADGDHGLHVHSQAPFQQSAKPEAPSLAVATLVRRLLVSPALPTGVEPAPSAFARGPPPSDAS